MQTAAHQQIQVTRITSTPMTPFQTFVAAAAVVLLLWLAYRIGVVILRLAAGLLFMGLLLYGVWYFFLK